MRRIRPPPARYSRAQIIQKKAPLRQKGASYSTLNIDFYESKFKQNLGDYKFTENN